MTTPAADHVLRRPSPIDPAPDAWAVVGAGTRGEVAIRALRSAGIPVVGYDVSTVAGGSSDSHILPGHEVIDIEEIDDVDALGVTSRDLASGVITTDYFAGVVVATGHLEAGVELGFLDDEMLNMHAGRPRLAREIFTPHHPALILLGVAGGYLDSLDQESRVIARYAALLRDNPRAALAYHRHACLALLDSLAIEQHPDRGDVSEEQRRDLLAADLLEMGA